MYIQGDLQIVFDALYSVGAIDPILKADWQLITKEMEKDPSRLNRICSEINRCSGNFEKIKNTILSTDPKSVEFLALEVAREYTEFQDRKQVH